MSEISTSDLRHGGYSEKYRSGLKCYECGKPAGTAWTEYWCPECDIERKERITKSLEAIDQRFEEMKQKKTKNNERNN